MKSIHWLSLAVAAAAILVLAACEGPAGSNGAQGPPGPPGSATSSTQDELKITITSVTVPPTAGNPVVNFAVTDQDNLPVANLVTLWQNSANTVRIGFAKLIASANGDASKWQSYRNNASGPSGSKRLQATTDNGGTLTYLGSGAYTYALSYDPRTATYPSGLTHPDDPTSGTLVGYDETLVHRVAMQISGQGLPAGNGAFDFIPNGTAVGTNSRVIVQTSSCNECHNRLALHGGSRYETKYCVVCHNPGTTDPDTGNTVDFKVMVHKIHMGKELPSVINGTPYQIIGYGGSVHDFGVIGYPQDIRRCSKCHDTADGTATPNAANWYDVPNKQACIACHDRVTLDGVASTSITGATITHSDQTANGNSMCKNCHTPTGSAISVQTAHLIPSEEASKDFAFEIVSVDYTGADAGGTMTVQFRVTDPQAGGWDSAAGSGLNWDILTDPEWTNSSARLQMRVAWDTLDYRNDGSGASWGQPLSVNAKSLATEVAGTCAANACTFQVQATIPAGLFGSATVALEGHPRVETVIGSGTYDLNPPVKSVVQAVGITDSPAVARRSPIDISSRCDNCHGVLSMHGANRTDEGQLCVMCHNPFATDINRRVGGPFDDGKAEEAIDFKRMIHGIHSQGSTKRTQELVIYGFGNTANHFNTSTVHFPGRISYCPTCHVGNTYQLPLSEFVWGSTVNTNTDDDGTDDLKFSKTASVCSACHDSELATTHMAQNGGSVEIRDATNAIISGGDLTETIADLGTGPGEACPLCHGPGRLADIAVMHVISP